MEIRNCGDFLIIDKIFNKCEMETNNTDVILFKCTNMDYCILEYNS